MGSQIVLLVGKVNVYAGQNSLYSLTALDELRDGILLHRKSSVNHMNCLCSKMLLVDSGIYKLQGKFLSFSVIKAANVIITHCNIK